MALKRVRTVVGHIEGPQNLESTATSIHGGPHQLPGAPDFAKLKAAWISEYGANGRELFLVAAPGRINIIGEHTDYNHGYVFPCALERYVCLLFSPRQDHIVNCLALDLEKDHRGRTDLRSVKLEKKHESAVRFMHYIVGQAETLRKVNDDKPLLGFDAVLSSTIPIGGGVSSSSALSVASALAYKICNPDFKASDADFFRSICEGEWSWSGVRGGIMDQYTSLNAKEGGAFILDCRTSKPDPKFSHVVLPKNVQILIANTNVKHELVGSPYNERRESCERAVKFIQQYLSSPDPPEITHDEKEIKEKAKKKGVTHLRDVSLELLRAAADYTKMDARAYRRAVHVITEDVRTIQTGEALVKGDLKTAGRLLNEGHASLRDDYKVSCEELDIIADIAQSTTGVYGARMMGGGFGGCCIVLVAPEHVKSVTSKIEHEYKKRAKIDATVIASRAGKGGHVIKFGHAK